MYNPRPRWGTYSVIDYLDNFPFVADVLLYDRLVIPYPADDAQVQQWERRDPSLQRLHQCLAILDKLAKKVSWGEEQQNAAVSAWQAAQQVNKGVRDPYYFDLPDASAYVVSTTFLPPIADTDGHVVAVAAYRSRAACQKDVPFSIIEPPLTDPSGPSHEQQQFEQTRRVRRERLGYLLCHTLLVPSGPVEQEFDTLRRAVDLANDPTFQQHRALVHQWQDDVITNNIPDEKALLEIKAYLDEYSRYMEQKIQQKERKLAYLLATGGLALATAATAAAATVTFPPLAIPMALAAGAIGGGVPLVQFALFEKDNAPEQDSRIVPAAMFYDAHTHGL